LFFLFWGNLALKAVKAYSLDCRKEVIIALMVILFFMIESTSDATITHNRGIFLMMLLGMIFSDLQLKTEKRKIDVNGEDTAR
jgi:hypothetical protein